jgi:ectoine hydroxylase-related dioxygenase (phytanoyl-CoA dioxygenase family)
MTAGLNAEQVADYRRDGFVSPVPAVPASTAAALRREMEAVEGRHGRLHYVAKPHILLPFVDALVRQPGILDAVQSLIGPDILLWDCSFIVKEPGDAKRVSWHQDVTYWGLAPVDGIVSIWLALSPATVDSGCMRMIPGSHRGTVQPHRDTYAADNILSRGQELAVAIDEAAAVDIVLAPGEMSLHHGQVFHGSQPNRSADRRIGFNAQYIAPQVRQTIGRHDSATLVRGHDAFGHFEDERRPDAEFEPAAVALREALSKRRAEYLYAGAAT